MVRVDPNYARTSPQGVRRALNSRCSHLGTTGLASDGQEELEFGRKLVLGVESVGEIYSSDTAVGVDLNSNQFKNKVSYMIIIMARSCYKIRQETYLRVSM